MKLLFALVLFSGGVYAGEVHVTIENIKFNPEVLEVHKGDTVIWENKDIVPHTVTTEKPAFDSKQIQPGHRFKWKVKGAGEIDYKCMLHPTMKAKLTIK